MSSSRFLQITRRRIPPEGSERHAGHWRTIVAAAKRVEANAWIFESGHVAGYFTEFIEWKGTHEMPVILEVDELDKVFPPEECSIWTETTI